jgi:hypothetical protein
MATLVLLLFGRTATTLGRWRVGLFADRTGTRRLLPGMLVVGVAGLTTLAAGLWDGLDTLLLGGAAVFGIAGGAVQNLTLVVAFARAHGHGTSTVSAVWSAAFDTDTDTDTGTESEPSRSAPSWPPAWACRWHWASAPA